MTVNERFCNPCWHPFLRLACQAQLPFNVQQLLFPRCVTKTIFELQPCWNALCAPLYKNNITRWNSHPVSLIISLGVRSFMDGYANAAPGVEILSGSSPDSAAISLRNSFIYNLCCGKSCFGWISFSILMICVLFSSRRSYMGGISIERLVI